MLAHPLAIALLVCFQTTFGNSAQEIRTKLNAAVAERQQLEQQRDRKSAEQSSLREQGRARRESELQQVDAAIRDIKTSIAEADAHIKEHTQSCDVVQADRRGTTVPAQTRKDHNKALQDAYATKPNLSLELLIRERDREFKQSSLDATSPEEFRLGGEISGLDGRVSGMYVDIRWLKTDLEFAESREAAGEARKEAEAKALREKEEKDRKEKQRAADRASKQEADWSRYEARQDDEYRRQQEVEERRLERLRDAQRVTDPTAPTLQTPAVTPRPSGEPKPVQPVDLTPVSWSQVPVNRPAVTAVKMDRRAEQVFLRPRAPTIPTAAPRAEPSQTSAFRLDTQSSAGARSVQGSQAPAESSMAASTAAVWSDSLIGAAADVLMDASLDPRSAAAEDLGTGSRTVAEEGIRSWLSDKWASAGNDLVARTMFGKPFRELDPTEQARLVERRYVSDIIDAPGKAQKAAVRYFDEVISKRIDRLVDSMSSIVD